MKKGAPLVLLFLLLLPATLANDTTQLFPPLLSELKISGGSSGLLLPPGFVPYEVNLPFWSDGADKHRWFRLPDEQKIDVHGNGQWVFPPGSTFIKDFYFEAKSGPPVRIETRVLRLSKGGLIEGVTYRWNKTIRDGERVLQAQTNKIWNPAASQWQDWYFPGQNDCKTCHNPVNGGVLGLNSRQLNRISIHPVMNQIQRFHQQGFLHFSGPTNFENVRLASFSDQTVPRIERVRSYLDVNCAFCHQPGGVAGNFDARYGTPFSAQNLFNGYPLIDLNIDGAKIISPGDKWRSILLTRLSDTNGLKMPPLGHQLPDEEAILFIATWIKSLPSVPVLDPPTISVKPSQNGQYLISLRHPDPAAELRFSTDGSSPAKSSDLFKKEFSVEPPAVIRARAYKSGCKKSIAVQEVISK